MIDMSSVDTVAGQCSLTRFVKLHTPDKYLQCHRDADIDLGLIEDTDWHCATENFKFTRS